MAGEKKILCCDWGTSAFRLMLVDPSSAQVIARDQTDQGIAQTFALWQQPENAAIPRETFYLDYVQGRIAWLEQRIQASLQNTPLVLSGMASSSVGITALPYTALPFAITGADLKVAYYPPSAIAAREIFLVSGVKSEETHEVMRGEETLVIGSASTDATVEDGWFILPGTHSKHIRMRGGQATELKTYMTGEFFNLLARHSMLRLSVLQSDRFAERRMTAPFKAGVIKGLHNNLLHSSFAVRTNDLFHQYKREENYYFLSGLLIGSELQAFRNEATTLTLVCGPTLYPLYKTALQVINAEGGSVSCRYQSAEEAIIRGQLTLYTFTKQNS